jgi:hypothetical protein
VDEDLGVAMGMEPVALFDEVFAELEVVVDFAVEDDLDAAVLVAEGLGAAAEVDDAEAAVAEGDGAVTVVAEAVGAAVLEGVAHPGHEVRVGGTEIARYIARNAAHECP